MTADHDRREPFRGGGLGLLALRVKLSREEPEAFCFHLKTGATLGDAAFAEDEDLLAGAERLGDDLPFFEGGVAV